jgi:AcrR family transcriptional regulator
MNIVTELPTTPEESPDARLPRGPHVLSREQVAANQRERLGNAMIELVGERGYAATTVSAVAAHAGVSRKTFYQHHADKQACFLATYDAVVAENVERVANTVDAASGARERQAQGLAALFERVLAHRHRARLVLIEVGAVGPEGIARRERLVSAYEGLLRENLGAAPGRGTIPNPLIRAVVGGFLKVLCTRVQSGAHAQLPALAPELVAWSFTYEPLPKVMHAGGEPEPARPPTAMVGGRAPGSLSPGVTSARRRAARRTPSLSRSFVVHSQRERILDAVAQLSAEKGYAACTVEDIVMCASVSLQAFYEHFANKEDAFLVAYEVGHGKSLAIVERAHETEPDWAKGVRAGIAALFDFLAAEPSFAHLALVDALIATERLAERSNKAMMSYAQLLTPGFDESSAHRRPPAVTLEAISGGIFELCLGYAARGHIADLSELVPWATYFALAPFLGAQKAARVAVGS